MSVRMSVCQPRLEGNVIFSAPDWDRGLILRALLLRDVVILVKILFDINVFIFYELEFLMDLEHDLNFQYLSTTEEMWDLELLKIFILQKRCSRNVYVSLMWFHTSILSLCIHMCVSYFKTTDIIIRAQGIMI